VVDRARAGLVDDPEHTSPARFKSAPFLVPAQPRPWTVETEWPVSAPARSWDSFSSSRTRTGQQRPAGDLEGLYRLLTPDGRELADGLIQRVAPLQVVEQGLHGYPRSDEHRCTTQDLRVAVHHWRIAGHDHGRIAWSSAQVGAGFDSRKLRAPFCGSARRPDPPCSHNSCSGNRPGIQRAASEAGNASVSGARVPSEKAPPVEQRGGHATRLTIARPEQTRRVAAR